jgi:hypothetical protein
MAQQTIVTTPHNSGSGDPAYTAFEKCNSNFTELYAGGLPIANNTVLGNTSGGTATPTAIGLTYIPALNLTLASLTSTYPAASYAGFSAYTTDQGLVFSNGTAWLLTTDTSVKAGLLTGSGNATANATAIMNAAAAGNLTVKLPAGTYYVGPMNFTAGGVQIQGEGVFSTILNFVPTGNTASQPGYSTTDPGTCFQFCTSAGQSIIYNCSLQRLSIQTTDTTYTKAAVRLCETSQFVLQDVLVSNFLGGNSCALQTMGHELADVKRFTASNCCIPIRMSVGLKAYGQTLSGVTITGTAGQFSCSAASLAVGQQVTIAGTYGGTGSITGYVDPTTYRVSATNGSTTFTLQTQAAGAIVTTAGTPTGLTITVGVVYSGDHFHFEDLYLIAGLGAGNVKTQAAQYYPSTLTSACILMDDNLFVGNMKWTGTQAWVGGQYGFYCNNPNYPGSINYNWAFHNVRKEQGFQNSMMFYYDNSSSSTYNLRQIYFENCYNTEGYTGWHVNGIYYVTMVNCMSPVINSGYVVDMGAGNVLGMDWRAMWCNSGDTINIPSTLWAHNAAYYTGYSLPFSASWTVIALQVAGQCISVQTPTTGFNITIGNNQNILYLTPAGTLATGTVTLPTPVDRQEATIGTSQTITAFTLTGGTIVGAAPATLSANTAIKYIYYAAIGAWYRIQ